MIFNKRPENKLNLYTKSPIITKQQLYPDKKLFNIQGIITSLTQIVYIFQ